MRRATLACASLLLLAGFTASCGDNDSNDDSKAKETSSASPSEDASASEDPGTSTGESDTPSTEESQEPSTEPSTDPSTGDGEADPSNATYCAAAKAASDAQTIKDLKQAVGDLDENLPDSASAEVESGLSYLKEVLAKAKDQESFVTEVQKGNEKEQKAVQAYGAFEKQTCPAN